jgi:hypothetical protein
MGLGFGLALLALGLGFIAAGSASGRAVSPRGAEAAAAPAPPAPSSLAEAFEVGLGDLDKLPAGKEADGIAGDFVLRNAWIEALVSGNLPGRKANMTTNSGHPTPGCLYDLCLRGSQNDQLTCLAPGNLSGPVSSVRVVAEGLSGPDSLAIVRVERTAARAGGLEETHEYRLAPEWRHLLIVSTYRNLGSKPVDIETAAVWKGLSGEFTVGEIRAADAMDPQDHQGYASAYLSWPRTEVAPPALGSVLAESTHLSLAPGKSQEVAVAVAPGRSPAEAYGAIAALRGPTGRLRARVLSSSSGRGIPTAQVEVPLEGKTLLAYPDAQGALEINLPPGDYQLTARDRGRPDVKAKVTIQAGGAVDTRFEMDAQARIAFDVQGVGQRKLPCKVQLIGVPPTPDPDLGPNIRAHGCLNQYHSETGWFTVAVPPGRYSVLITRGMEYDHYSGLVEVRAGQEATVSAVLQRIVDTRGWVSTDFHNHSTPSGDNYCGTDDRLINLAAEGVEFAPTTEHNRFYDWTPHLARLALEEEIATVVGIELTGSGAHLNSFPMRVRPGLQDNGAPTWTRDPRINAMVLRDWAGGGPDRWVQLNHPSVGEFFRDRDADGVPDGGFEGLELLIDAAEVWSAEILQLTPIRVVIDNVTGKFRRIENRTFSWLQLLNQGRRMWCVAVSDAHAVFNGGVGGWRTFVPCSTDSPAQIDYREIVRNAKAGRMVVTNGPFLEAALADGTLPGGSTVVAGRVSLRVRVQCNTWVNIDRVQVIVNGRAPAELNFTAKDRPDLFRTNEGDPVRFEGLLEVPLREDSWIIAVAFGQGFDLRTGFGRSWQAGMHPCAFHNPIYVDVDGDGFRANGDTLGYPLPVAYPIRRDY